MDENTFRITYSCPNPTDPFHHILDPNLDSRNAYDLIQFQKKELYPKRMETKKLPYSDPEGKVRDKENLGFLSAGIAVFRKREDGIQFLMSWVDYFSKDQWEQFLRDEKAGRGGANLSNPRRLLTFLGGKRQKNGGSWEKPEATAIREAVEETGGKLTPQTLVKVLCGQPVLWLPEPFGEYLMYFVEADEEDLNIEEKFNTKSNRLNMLRTCALNHVGLTWVPWTLLCSLTDDIKHLVLHEFAIDAIKIFSKFSQFQLFEFGWFETLRTEKTSLKGELTLYINCVTWQ